MATSSSIAILMSGAEIRDALHTLDGVRRLDAEFIKNRLIHAPKVSAGNSAVATNAYLKGPGSAFMNQSPFVMPWDMKLIAISAATNGDKTWIVEIYKNANIISSPVSGNRSAFMTLSSQNFKREILVTPVQFDDQDRIAIYCSGTAINRPTVTLFFEEYS